MMPLVLVGPLLMLATAVVALWSHGPLGWLGAVLLVVSVVLVTRMLVRRVARWWRGTKAPVREPLSAGGRGPASAARPVPPAGTSRG